MPGPDAHGPDGRGPDVALPVAPLVVGRMLGARYELLRPIARGGMAEVWEGQDAILCRPVAVKVLQTHLAADASFVERFRREAVTAARVAHPCVVATFDAGVDAGTAYIVMELVRGQTLRQLLTASAPLDPDLAVAIALQVADALADAHRAGLVHRDVKPANVLLCDDDGGGLRVKVTDFGIAKVEADLEADLTRTGTVLGTPKYLSPEQVEGRADPDGRSDLYALGVVLFEMLVGRPPFEGHNEIATALSHLHDTPPRLASARPGISTRLDALVADLLAKSPLDRPQTAVAVRRALEVIAKEGACAAVAPARPATPRAATPRAATPRPATPRPAARAATSRPDTAPDRTHSDRGGRPADGAAPRPPALDGPVGNDAWRRNGAARHLDAPAPRADAVGARTTGAAPRNATGTVRTVPTRDGDRATRDATGAGRRSPGPTEHRPTRAATSRRGRRRRVGRGPGSVVAVIGLAAVVLAAILIAGQAGDGSGPARIRAVTVWMNTTTRPLDDPGGTRYVSDGDPATAWHTDPYVGRYRREFGGLYSGLGLAVRLSGPRTLHRMVVLSPTHGWAASAYVAATAPPAGSAVSAWGAPTASARAIAGNVTLSLAGRTGEWVLLWLTDTGPGAQVSISEITVH